MIIKLNSDKNISVSKNTPIYIGEKNFDKIEVQLPDKVGEHDTADLTFIMHLVTLLGEYVTKTLIVEDKVASAVIEQYITSRATNYYLYLEMLNDDEIIGKTNTISLKVNPLPDEQTNIEPVLIDKNIEENGEYRAAEDNADGYRKVTVAVPIPASEKNVNLYDMDFTLLYSYTKDEALALTALPTAGGEHEGYVFRGWNWTLEHIKSFIQNNPHADRIPVQAQYDVGVEKRELRLHLTIPTPLNTEVPLNFSLTEGVLTVDWGDGNITEETVSTTHLYSFDSYPASVVIKATYDGDGRNVTWGFTILGSAPYTNMLTNAEVGFGVLSGGVFQNYRTLSTIVLGKAVTSLPDHLCYGCESLSIAVLPDSLTSAGFGAFYGCFALSRIILPSQITVGGESLFDTCYSLREIVLPETFTAVPNYMFSNCYSLREVTIPISVVSIGTRAFRLCYTLTALVLPDTLTTMGSESLNGCGIISLKIPKSVTSIGSYAFYACDNFMLLDLSEFDGEIPTLENSNAFGNTPAALRFATKNEDMTTTFSAAQQWGAFSNKYVVKTW